MSIDKFTGSCIARVILSKKMNCIDMENLITNNRSIYHIKNTDLYLAVADNFLREIRECTAEYGALEKVPVYRSVKGIVFRILNEHLFELMNNGIEVEYAISSLEFETGSSRLIA